LQGNFRCAILVQSRILRFFERISGAPISRDEVLLTPKHPKVHQQIGRNPHDISLQKRLSALLLMEEPSTLCAGSEKKQVFGNHLPKAGGRAATRLAECTARATETLLRISTVSLEEN